MGSDRGQDYVSTKVRRRVLAQARELIQEVKQRGTGSLPPELQHLFQDGLTPSAVLEAGLELLKDRWSEKRR